MRYWLPVIHLALVAVVALWDVILCGRIAQSRQSPRPFAAVTGLAGLLLLPALLALVATSTVITGQAIEIVDWLWPLVLVLFAVQAAYALVARLVNPTWGVPIAIYDVVVAIAGVSRWAVGHGAPVPRPFLILLAAQASALYLATTPIALGSPIYFLVPMVSPAFPALRKITATFRAAMTALAIGWLVLLGVQLPTADEALANYELHAGDRLTERPSGDFAVGLKVFPDVRQPPPPAAIQSDIALADTLGVDVVSVVVVPDVSNKVLDSTASALDELQRDSTVLIVSLGYRGKLLPELGGARLKEPQRLDAIRRIVTRLHPDILLPAEDPYGTGARLVGRLSVEQWKDYLTAAAATAKRADRGVRIGVSIAAFDSRDSSLYAWAASRGSPIDVVGFSFWPGRRGEAQVDAEMRAADRWMRVTPPAKPHWVFATGGYPLAQGEQAQQRAIWSSLAWATARPAVKGLVVYEAGDYGQARGLRAPNGRLRSSAIAVLRALKALREATVAPAAPTR